MNPFDAIATLILGKIKEGIWAEWLKFLFELGFSALVSFLFVTGTALVADAESLVAIGAGMIASALSLTVLFRRENSRLTKGMLVVLPSAEAAKEIATDFEIIQKAEQEKNK
jgi:ABC-type multidrug transport system permease subunit